MVTATTWLPLFCRIETKKQPSIALASQNSSGQMHDAMLRLVLMITEKCFSCNTQCCTLNPGLAHPEKSCARQCSSDPFRLRARILSYVVELPCDENQLSEAFASCGHNRRRTVALFFPFDLQDSKHFFVLAKL
uniref:Uncharacterized protein n=1 Tax=Globodera rostochiensis TaxID=31243 RepID=A0A914I0X6_GLORO